MRQLTLPALLLFFVPGSGCNMIAGIDEPILDESVGSSCNKELTVSKSRVQACLYRISCDPLSTAFTLSQCVSLRILESRQDESCNVRADSCDDVQECLHRKLEPTSACESQAKGWNCRGDEALYCDDSFAFSVDCAANAGTCATYPEQDDLFVIPCQPAGTQKCEGLQAGQYRCDGSVRYTCIDGKVFGEDCQSAQLDCVENGDEQAFCSGLTEACDDPGTATCTDGSVTACEASGRLATYACASSDDASSAQLSCVVDSQFDRPDCLADGCQTAARCSEGCIDDEMAQFCVGGVPFRVRCDDFGLGTCAEILTTSREPSVYCTPAPTE